jgi:hypothetical protein
MNPPENFEPHRPEIAPPYAPQFVSTATIARLAGCDRRTASRRLAAAGKVPDAALVDIDGSTLCLWSRTRALDLVAFLDRRGVLEEFIANSSAA